MLVVFKGFANLADLSAVHPNRLMQLLAGDVKFLCPIVNV